MDINQILGPARPFFSLIGSLLIIGGLAKFFGINVPITGGGLEIAVAGYLLRSI